MVQDLEIKDEPAFINALKNFILTQKINHGEVVILLDSSVYFSQVVTENSNSEESKKAQEENDQKVAVVTEATLVDGKKVGEAEAEIEEQRQLFVRSMPFANVYSTVVTIAKAKTIVALNRELYEPIVKLFNESKLEVTHIYPMLVVADVFTTQGFTKAAAEYLLVNREKYKYNNFLQSKKDSEIITTVMPTENKDKKRVLLLVILFIVLLASLGVIWWWSQQNAQKDATKRLGPAQPVSGDAVVIPTPIPSATPQSAVAQVVNLQELLKSSESAALSVSIIDASGDEISAQTLQSQLALLGFTNVVIGEKTIQQAGALDVSVQPTVPINLKEALLKELVAVGYSPTFQESETQTHAFVITVMAK
jgi:hypothetical protein